MALKKAKINKEVVKYRFKKKGMFLVNRRMTLPNGLKIEKDIVIHPGASLMVPFLNADQLIILRQFRSTFNEYSYEFPAGTLEPGEKPMACAHREMMEEAGYRAGKLTRVGVIHPVPGYSNEKIYIFKAEKLTPRKEMGDADEILTPYIISRSKLKQLFKTGKITDAKTIAGLAFCGII